MRFSPAVRQASEKAVASPRLASPRLASPRHLVKAAKEQNQPSLKWLPLSLQSPTRASASPIEHRVCILVELLKDALVKSAHRAALATLINA